MAGPQAPVSNIPINSSSSEATGNFRFALTALTVLFFMWGFLTCLNDILIPHLKAVFNLSYTQAMLIQFCFFGAYATVSLPAGALVKRIGYQSGIVGGLSVAAVGCLLFYPAAESHSYPVFLGALFVLASGITLLQVSANPYVTALGDPATASSRLTMTQAFNSLGTTVAPFFGGVLILSAATVGAEALSADAEADAVKLPYLMLAGILAALAVIFSKLKLPKIEMHEDKTVAEEGNSVWSHRHLVLGAVGIFVYVGAEVSIGSFLVNFLGLDSVAAMEEAKAAHYIAYYWGGAMIGRFIGAVVMRSVSPGLVLAFNAAAAILLVFAAILGAGAVAMWAILLVGLFNSIMFPTIFSLALQGLGRQAGQASGVLCLAIVGGAIVPLIQGVVADTAGLQLSFLVPVVCYVYIAYYGLKGSKVTG
ncbi:sugar MFS transporter [Microbulbifer hydrolyticus]|uniref:FHS family L-fucose permease-like MFS transporter n=1 Tax=Microbulbifer hydrolyticus TaxID=48074 RepID=A0A6P1T8S3_9GAMM|nr:sugar MFS transporter [Microbulbifer hydrolyticus]MBB5212748.1 FHS family L-fucose permease-like MFS transporter [Microbulbifer hydrolyticus]QHQ38447.1 glucose/galactose MFS transporter [Microbulbifer hydrolyticus]